MMEAFCTSRAGCRWEGLVRPFRGVSQCLTRSGLRLRVYLDCKERDQSVCGVKRARATDERRRRGSCLAAAPENAPAKKSPLAPLIRRLAQLKSREFDETGCGEGEEPKRQEVDRRLPPPTWDAGISQKHLLSLPSRSCTEGVKEGTNAHVKPRSQEPHLGNHRLERVTALHRAFCITSLEASSTVAM
jgi:hypothetical protein